MGKRVRLLASALALGALLGSVFIGAIGASAAKSARQLANQTCVFVCRGDGFNIYRIGVDAINPPTKNFEYTDFFPNGFKQTATASSSATTPSLTIRDGDVLHFLWTPGASLDSAHTVTFPHEGETLAAAQDKYSPLQPDVDDGPGKFIGNPLTFTPTSRDCGTADNPCSYDGSHNLNSGFLTNHNQDGKASEFFVRVELDLNSTGTSTVHFFCALHRGMVGQARVLGSDYDTSTTNEGKMAADALAQYTKDTAAGIAAETAANQTAVATNSDGSKTVTMTAGTAAPNVEVMEMLPNNVSIKAGDKVTWVDKGFDIHTVTFPNGAGSNSVDPFQPPVCEGTGTTDTPATGGPPTFGCTSPDKVEMPIELGPKGPTAIASTSTVASSGVLLSSLAGAPLPDRFTFSFPNAGTFAYQCRVHDNMIGTIAVAAIPAPPAPPVLAATGGGAPLGSLALLLGALALLAGLAVLQLRTIVRE
jgi:plastocyanin